MNLSNLKGQFKDYIYRIDNRRKVLFVILSLHALAILWLFYAILSMPGFGILSSVANIIYQIIPFFWPLFERLLLISLSALWLPILYFFVVNRCISSSIKRLYCNMLFILVYFVYVKNSLIPSELSVDAFVNSIYYCTNLYFLFLLLAPRELWNFFGMAVSSIYAALIYLMPDLPTMLDDLGFMSAFFSYVFLFLHTLASIVQRFTTRFVSVIQSSEQKSLTS